MPPQAQGRLLCCDCSWVTKPSLFSPCTLQITRCLLLMLSSGGKGGSQGAREAARGGKQAEVKVMSHNYDSEQSRKTHTYLLPLGPLEPSVNGKMSCRDSMWPSQRFPATSLPVPTKYWLCSSCLQDSNSPGRHSQECQQVASQDQLEARVPSAA